MATSVDTSQIPVDYIHAFEDGLAQAFADADAITAPAKRDVLANLLRQVIDHNAYIQPDGSIAYIQALNEEITAAIARRNGVGGSDDASPELSRRTQRLAIAGLVLLIVYIGWFMWRSRPSAQAARLAIANGEGAIATVVGIETVSTDPTPTFEPLPPVSQDALAAIDGNGERLTLGSPSLLEIVYSDERVTALPISPAGLTDVGALRYQEAVMLSDSPVAVWLANTRLNYGIGIPRDMIRRLTAGDRIRLFTNTGVEIPFLIREVTTRRSYQTTDILKQDEIGLALFALPASSDESVDVAFAVYDVSHEQQIGSAAALGTLQPLENLMVTVYDGLQVNEQADGQIALKLQGTVEGELLSGQQLLVNVTSADGQQTGTIPLLGGSWTREFLLPASAQGQRALVEMRLLPNGELVSIQLPTLPILREQLVTSLIQAWWQPDTTTTLQLRHVNAPENGRVWFSAEDLSLTHSDGQPLTTVSGRALPFPIDAGETVSQTISLTAIQPDTPIIVQVGQMQWEVLSSP